MGSWELKVRSDGAMASHWLRSFLDVQGTLTLVDGSSIGVEVVDIDDEGLHYWELDKTTGEPVTRKDGTSVGGHADWSDIEDLEVW